MTEKKTIDLRWQKPNDILSRADDLRRRFQAGLVGQIEMALEMASFLLRDPQKRYWFLDAYDRQWHLYELGRWEPSSIPSTSLEGRASLSMLPEAALDPLPNAEWTALDRAHAVQDLARVVEMVRTAYQQGRLSSERAESFLERHVLIDQKGRIWALGIHSPHWYTFEQDSWTRSAYPPEPDSLLRLGSGQQVCTTCGQAIPQLPICPHCGSVAIPEWADAADAAFGQIIRFLLFYRGSLPESIADPWSPPSSFPKVEIPHPMSEIEATSAQEPTAISSEAAEQWQAVIIAGAEAGSSFALGERTRIGRETDNEIRLSGQQISRHHSVIERTSGGYQIVDLGSVNGTYVNGQRITGAAMLQNGDKVAIHVTEIAIRGPGAPREELPRSVICLRCGQPLRPNAKFCGNCGAKQE